MAHKDIVPSLAEQLKSAELSIRNFESQIQSGEIDATEHEAALIRSEKDRARKLAKYDNDVKQIIARADGRRVLWRILEVAGPARISHVPGDPHTTAFNEGKRWVANEILLMLFNANMDVYAQMQREHASELKLEQERKKQEETPQ